MTKSICCIMRLDRVVLNPGFLLARTNTSKSNDRQIEECYKLLNLPLNSKQDAVRQAFLELAKKYHPDSGSPEADMDKFVAVDHAFRTLSKHNTDVNNKEEVEKIVFDIRHIAPQHRQYLSYEGHGHGTPFQREKQYIQARAQKAAINVMEHRTSKAMASDKALMKKGQYGSKHDIKTKYGFDRLVEDLIQESMSKGEFANLSGRGKPLKDQNTNPYVDFTTHKLNEVLINNGFTPEWITMAKEIDEDIKQLKIEIGKDRQILGPHPLSGEDIHKWDKIYNSNKELASSINNKINTYNIIVPLLNKQKFHVEFDKMCEEVLEHGLHSITPVAKDDTVNAEVVDNGGSHTDDLFTVVYKAFEELLTFGREKKKAQ